MSADKILWRGAKRAFAGCFASDPSTFCFRTAPGEMDVNSLCTAPGGMDTNSLCAVPRGMDIYGLKCGHKKWSGIATGNKGGILD